MNSKMKRLTILASMIFGALLANAQTMYIWHNGVAVAVGASEAGVMNYLNDGTDLQVKDSTFSVANIDSVTMGDAVDTSTVSVAYSGESATVVIPFALARTVSATVSGAYVTVNSTATSGDDINYALSGTSSNGAFTQNGKYKCTLTLNGLTLTSQQGAAISFINGKRINVNLADGTTNTLSDMTGGTQKACFYVKGHPEISGNGTLTVTGNTGHGISSTEYMYVESGTINVLSAVKDGIHAGQYFSMKDGSVAIANALDDGIQAEVTDDVDDEYNGQVIISGGTIDITSTADDGKLICSDSLMTISGGTITINGNGDGIKGISSDADLVMNEDDGDLNVTIVVDGDVYTDPTTAETSKTRGIKVDGDFTISAGTLSITATGTKSKSINVDGVSTKGSAASVTTNDSFSFDKTVN